MVWDRFSKGWLAGWALQPTTGALQPTAGALQPTTGALQPTAGKPIKARA